MYKKLYTTAMTALLVGAAAFGAAYPGIAMGAPRSNVKGVSARYLVRPTPLPIAAGFALDQRGDAYVAQGFLDRISA